MREPRRGKVNIKVMTMIAHNYDRLRAMCVSHGQGLYCSKSKEDLFQDTVVFVSQDEKASSLSTDKELIDYFCYRFRMIEYQAINDNKLLKEIPYADYLQASKTTEEE
nr:MAG TPA: RNA-dependent RNA polymerase [Caudoviricetes sp.]